MTKASRSGEQGFTLLEVLVAFVILSVFLGALLQSFSVGFRSLNAAESHALAMLHAQSKMEEVGILIAVGEKSESGEFENGFRWDLEMLPFEAESESGFETARSVPYEVLVTVSWDDDASVTLKSLRFKPQQ